MRQMLREELAHIPKKQDLPDEPLGQSLLRFFYSARRQSDLKHDPATPREVTLQRAVSSLQTAEPGFIPEYDHGYFRL